jgi:hypothetical protein
MSKLPDHNDPNVSIREEGRRVAERNHKRALKHAAREQRRFQTLGGLNTEPGLIAPPRPSHYHIAYELPAEQRLVVHFTKGYDTQRQAYAAVHAMGEASEPQTEWYEDGRVMIETTLHGRSGLFRIILRVAACINKKCGRADSPIILPDSVKVLH